MATLDRDLSALAMPISELFGKQMRHHANVVKRSTREMGDVLTKKVMTANDRRRLKRQYYPTYPGYYNPVYSGSYYYPAYPGFYNPVGSGSLWAAGGGLVGNTLSFLLGK
ncbi:unnamed protein product [Cylicocyclus nassatus]|uniref:Uncharacterized protein n=1 Tax=Cylicocyclus nassatus TaxID=53992 RepID=A0AA36DS56_CYLNA|nr:unnamed protein product [Cylicocyclus nassatus]